MRLKKIAAIFLAATLALACASPAGAAIENTEIDDKADYIFYRSKPTQLFEGEIDIRNGKSGTTSAVQIKEGETPAFSIYDFDDTYAYFDSLYRSVQQTLTVTRSDRDYEVSANLAVYDSVQLTPATGSVTLKVKDNRTLRPVANTEYALYKEGKLIENALVSDKDGKITVSGLAAGDYELRQTTASSGYQLTTKPVPFTLGGIQLSGGEYQVRTTSGKKITAEENELLIAGAFSPDVELSATKEEQIQSIAVTYKNYGAEVDSAGKDLKHTYSTVEDAQKAINEAKNNGEICGSVLITYTLAGSSERSTCNYIQYVETEIQEATPTPAPTSTPTAKPDNNNNNGNHGSPISPTATPSPSTAPQAATGGKLTIIVSTDSGNSSGLLFNVIGLKADGSTYNQSFKTDDAGEIVCSLPAGSYTVGLQESSGANEGVSTPEPQNVTISNGNATYLTFALEVTQRSFNITVVDDDGIPLENVLLGVFEPIDSGSVSEDAPDISATPENATDVSKAITLSQQKQEEEKRRANPYAKENALNRDTSNAAGQTEFKQLPTTELVAAVISAPDGYAVSSEPFIIPADSWDTEYTFVCEYVKVDISVIGESTDKPVLGATATLSTGEGTELTSWEVTDTPHRLIRVPADTYTLNLDYGEESDTLTLEINNDEPQQEISLKSVLIGNITLEPEPVDESENKTKLIVLIVVISIVAVLIIVVCILLWRKHRKRSGGYK